MTSSAPDTPLARPDRSGFRWIVLALVATIYMLVAVDRANLGIAIPSIKAEFAIGNADAGLFVTLMFIAFAAAQMPASMICRRFGLRSVMAVALLAAALASFMIGESTSTLDIKIYRSFLGVAESAISVCCITALNNWFSVKERGTATGYFYGTSKMGPVLCPPLSIWILQIHGWRTIFQTFAVPVMAAAILWYALVRDRPEQSRRVSRRELDRIHARETGGVERRAVRPVRIPAWIDRVIRYRRVEPIDTAAGVFRSWDIIGIGVAGIFMFGIFNVFLAWIPSYLLEARGFPPATVGIITAAPFAGAVAGNFAGGWISDNLLGMRRKPLMMGGAMMVGLAMLSLIYAPADEILTGILLLLTGFMVGLGYPHFSSYPMSLTTRDAYPIAYGLTNTGAAVGAAVFPYLAGLVLDAASWSALFAFLSASAIACLVVLATIIEPAVDRG